LIPEGVLMEIRLAIHHTDGSFSTRWKTYCDDRQIPYKVVNCLETGIIQELARTDGLLWHWEHLVPANILVARHVLMAAEALGLLVFPNTSTCWHYDDKIAQKYLLESVGAPLVPTYVFYDLEEAHRWIGGASFPKVFKLRNGAGSQNVQLVRNHEEARILAQRAFSRGFRAVPQYWNDARKRYRVTRRQRDLLGVLRRLPNTLRNIRKLNRMIAREKGYIYFQDFVPDNQFDTRVTVIGNRAFAYIRKVRPGDFRASGSGDMDYDPHKIRLQCVQAAFEVAQRVGSQSMAFDFVLERDGRPMIVEVSYCYVPDFVYNCPGHWDRKLNWHEGHMWPQDAILIDLLEDVGRRKSSRGPSVCGFVSTGL
jgi:glutathione synthase/RimK-type ligase-like ATP-grasp enzyme